MSRFLGKLLCDARGATAIEYGMIIGVIAAVLVTSFSVVGGGVAGAWSTAANKVAAVEP